MSKIFWGIIYFMAALILSFFLYFFFDDAGNCISDGKVWDGEQKICRDDCIHWDENKGCVKE